MGKIGYMHGFNYKIIKSNGNILGKYILNVKVDPGYYILQCSTYYNTKVS